MSTPPARAVRQPEVYVCDDCEASREEAGEVRDDRAVTLNEYLSTERKAGSYPKLRVVRGNDREEHEVED